jgi:L-ascorbate metabolism protein UlaG (beta-lactamase superfamily)
VKVKWLGHAAFLITSEAGTRIVTDPYGSFAGLNYKPVDMSADVVTVSHDHGDHNNAKAVKGAKVVKGAGTHTVAGVTFEGTATYHDDSKGKQRGPNTIFCFTMDGVRVCHAGDLGHMLSEAEVSAIGSVDVLLLPVGGFYTLDAKAASAVTGQIKPRAVVPMHVRNASCEFPIAEVEEFLKGRESVQCVDGSEVEFRAGQLPPAVTTVVLKPANC